ncbi:esterase-like activity of phytase family protein [Phenylobacterium immobile]|uniref:esterase-like activity of phytase family protein n=1 Tax=Phenylobacterium immobile TaxID=21 RepID=UPI000AC08E32|nr:esterase-like activity of phytase family protein [Phenylobacterium immobile]
MRAAVGALLLAALAACAPIAELPSAPVPYGPAIAIRGAPVPMEPADPTRERLGNFTYAGGLHITSDQTSRLHGLSDLKVWPDGRFLAQGDQSDVVEGRLVLDVRGRLAGVTDAHMHALKDADGLELYAKGQKEFDAEGVAELPNGDRLVSFEQHDRILLYPRDGSIPRQAAMPTVRFKNNDAMEALATDPATGPDAYRVGVEETGEVYACRLSASCVLAGKVALDSGAGLVAMERMPGGRWAYLLRSYSAVRGNVVRLRITDSDGTVVDEVELAKPLTVDNLEGLGVVAGPGRRVRFYLVSDDNFGMYNGLPTDQRTLLLAFDWSPP